MLNKQQSKKRLYLHAQATREAEKNGHKMGLWSFSALFNDASYCKCLKCGKEIVCGLPLTDKIGRALSELCGE